MRRTLFDSYLFRYCSVKYQTFHQVSEKTSQQTFAPKKHLKSFPDTSKSHKTTNQVISRQSITGEQGEKFCKTLLAPFERPDLGSEEPLSIKKNKLRALVYHVINSTNKELIST